MQGRRNLTGTKGCLFSFLPVSGNPIWEKKTEVAVRGQAGPSGRDE